MSSAPHERSRYGKYAGGDPLAPPVDLAEALDAIGEDVMAGYSPEHAMQEFLRRGGPDQRGLDDLAREVAFKKRELLKKHRLDGTLQEVRDLLDKAVLAERKQLARDLDDDARFNEIRIDNLPPSTAAAVSDLQDYPWRSTEARETYEQIKDLLGREALDQRFAGMKRALHGASDDDRARVAQMLDDLNELLEARERGEDTDEAFREFMDEHGDIVGDDPQDLDDLLDSLAQRAAAARRLRNSLTPEQRAELDELAQQAFGTPALMERLDRLDANLRAARPDENWGGSQEFDGDQGLGLGDGTGVLQDLADLDDLAEQLSQQYAGSQIGDVDLDALARQLGDEAVADARALADLERALRDQGYLTRTPDGSLQLSPSAMRRLGKALLRDVARRLSGRAGQRDTRRAGAAGDLDGSTSAWEFGDTRPWNVTRTVTNAVQRTVAAGCDARGGVRLTVDDIEVSETEARTQACVVLLADTSFSMAMDGRWVPMKRTALALHQLVTTRFRGDSLELITFARYAQTMRIDTLTGLEPEWDKGTNLHHALMLANRHFRRHPNAQPVLLIVTDGEPTAHLDTGGRAEFSYPPHPLTLAQTVRELDASARLGAQATFFRLGEDPGLQRFVEQMARRVGGQVVAPELDDLGAAVVGSYLGSRGGRSRGGPLNPFGDLRRNGWFD